jgi:hypothetical protein
MRNDGEGIIETQQQGVAVRLAVRHRLGGDERAAARTVLYDHRPAPLGRKRTRKHAPDHIHGRPGGERHNDAGQPGFLRDNPAGADRYGQSNGTKADQYASAQRHITVASSHDDARMRRTMRVCGVAAARHIMVGSRLARRAKRRWRASASHRPRMGPHLPAAYPCIPRGFAAARRLRPSREAAVSRPSHQSASTSTR